MQANGVDALAQTSASNAQKPANSRALHGSPLRKLVFHMLDNQISTTIAQDSDRVITGSDQTIVGPPWHLGQPAPLASPAKTSFGSQSAEWPTPVLPAQQINSLDLQQWPSSKARRNLLLMTDGGY